MDGRFNFKKGNKLLLLGLRPTGFSARQTGVAYQLDISLSHNIWRFARVFYRVLFYLRPDNRGTDHQQRQFCTMIIIAMVMRCVVRSFILTHPTSAVSFRATPDPIHTAP